MWIMLMNNNQNTDNVMAKKMMINKVLVNNAQKMNTGE